MGNPAFLVILIIYLLGVDALDLKLYMNRYFHFPIFTFIEYSLETMNVQLGVCPVVIFHKIC